MLKIRLNLRNVVKTVACLVERNVNLKILVMFPLLLLNISVNAEECEGYYVTNNLDTIKCKIDISKNIFWKDVYHFHWISEGVRLIDAEGVKFFRPQEITSFVVTVPNGVTCKFISVQTDNRYFYREMAVGKISMYLKYQTHSYDGGMLTDCVFFKNGQSTILGFMNTKKNQRKKVNLLLSDNPEVLAKWEKVKFTIDTLQEIIEEYNK